MAEGYFRCCGEMIWASALPRYSEWCLEKQPVTLIRLIITVFGIAGFLLKCDNLSLRGVLISKSLLWHNPGTTALCPSLSQHGSCGRRYGLSTNCVGFAPTKKRTPSIEITIFTPCAPVRTAGRSKTPVHLPRRNCGISSRLQILTVKQN